ncbi:unnamed protein product [Mytilus edulis]|uniref:Uncharacterized protein n=1 Tax=Mytilus edulis TaxID=6550 RepID=A0A8S3PUD1_MYTED|nr:unnamed protein product [Mytilus edulis]
MSSEELTKNENKVRDKLVDIESQNLKQNLVFFELEEASENNEGAKGGATGEKGGATGSTYNENCVNKILEFCENQLKIENAKDKITLEKAYRLGKRKNGAAKPRPIVVKFRKFEDREMIRSVSNRLKNTNYGISPQYPKEVLERRKKLVPIMLKERKKNKKAYIAGDKLYVNESLEETTDTEYVDLLEIISKFKAPVTGLAVGSCTSILPFKTSNTVSFICSYCKKLERPPKLKPENNVKSDQDCANEPNSLDINSNECILNKNSTHENKENSITLCESDNNDMSTILNNIFPDCSDKMKTFLISQKMALERHPNGRRWNRDIVQLCLSLWCRSPVDILI